jgi:hypothetical protein
MRARAEHNGFAPGVEESVSGSDRQRGKKLDDGQDEIVTDVSVVVVSSSVVVVVGASVVVVVGASVVVVVGASVVVVVGASVVVVGASVVVVVDFGRVVVVVGGGDVVVVVVGNGSGSGNSSIGVPSVVVVVLPPCEGLVEMTLGWVCVFPGLLPEEVVVVCFVVGVEEFFGLLKITIFGTTVVAMTPGTPDVVGVLPVLPVLPVWAGTVTAGFETTVVGTAARVGSLMDLNGPLRYRPMTRPVVTTTPATATASHLFHAPPPYFLGIWRCDSSSIS